MSGVTGKRRAWPCEKYFLIKLEECDGAPKSWDFCQEGLGNGSFRCWGCSAAPKPPPAPALSTGVSDILLGWHPADLRGVPCGLSLCSWGAAPGWGDRCSGNGAGIPAAIRALDAHPGPLVSAGWTPAPCHGCRQGWAVLGEEGCWAGMTPLCWHPPAWAVPEPCQDRLAALGQPCSRI